MSFDNPDNILRLLQILAIGSAVITALVTGIKFLNKKLMHDVKEYLSDDLDDIRKNHSELKSEVSLLKQMMEFFEKYLLPVKPKERYGDEQGKDD